MYKKCWPPNAWESFNQWSEGYKKIWNNFFQKIKCSVNKIMRLQCYKKTYYTTNYRNHATNVLSIVRIKFYFKECKIRHAFSAQAKCLETKSLFMKTELMFMKTKFILI